MSIVRLKDIMTRYYIKADPDIPLAVLRLRLEDEKIEAVLFEKKGTPAGIASKSRILGTPLRDNKSARELLQPHTPSTLSEETEISLLASDIKSFTGGILTLDSDGNLSGIIPPDSLALKILHMWQSDRAHLHTLMSHSSEAVCIIDQQEKVVGWNSRAEALYNIRNKDILGQPLSSFFSNVMVTKALRDGIIFKELYHQPREGEHVIITAAPINLNGKIIGSLSLERNIADIVYLNEELSRSSFRVQLLKNEIDRLSQKDAFAKIFGHSTAIKDTINIAKKFAATDTTLLITGESGSGKELFARAVHQASSRSRQPFVAVNCGALPQPLFESEVFGYEGGAFTGAFKEGKPGKFELANGGTLFLDEIGELEYSSQVKLLRVLQENIFYRVGGTKPIKVDVRIIAATNSDLETMHSEGRFREDLYYRLNVISLSVPPLRQRKQDIPELAYLLTQELASRHNIKITEFEPEVMIAFMNYHWPGNVRELRNILERAVILAEDEVIRQDSLPGYIKIKVSPELLVDKPGEQIKLPEATRGIERQMILDALRDGKNNKAEAAKILGIPRSSLYYRMKVLGIASNT